MCMTIDGIGGLPLMLGSYCWLNRQGANEGRACLG